MRQTKLALAVVVGLLSCKNDGCGANKPAAADASDAALVRDRTMRVVAIAPTLDLKVHRLADDTLVFALGDFFYEGRSDGALVPIAAPKDIAVLERPMTSVASFIDRAPLEFLYGERDRFWIRREQRSFPHADDPDETFVGDPRATLFRFDKSGLRPDPPKKELTVAKLVRFEGALVGAAYGDQALVIPDPGARTNVSAPIIPEGASIATAWQTLFVGDGRLVALTRRPGAIVWSNLGSPGKVIPLDIDGGDPSQRAITAFDGHVYLAVSTGPTRSRTTVLHRLDAQGWQRAPYAISDVTWASVASDGTLYNADLKKLSRCPPTGAACEDIPLSLEGVPLPKLHYTDAGASPRYERDGHVLPALRVALPREPGSSKATPVEVIARSPDDVWVITHDNGHTRLFHSGPTRDVLQLPSAIDGAAMLRMASTPPAPWSDHCEPVFLALTRRAEGGTIDRELSLRSEPRIRELLGVEPDPSFMTFEGPLGWALIEGKLGSETVAGVLVHRNDDNLSLADFEKRVTKLMEALSDASGTAPAAFCELPVLERSLSK